MKGGLLREAIPSFPGTLRMAGPEYNTALNYMVRDMVYETLLSMHPTTLEDIPSLATHWQVSPDKTTYRFRINPNARWVDGEPVIAQDVVATWNFMMDEGLQAPTSRMTWSKFAQPFAESKYIVRVQSTKVNWRNFLYFAQSMYIFPAHVLKDVNGETYLRDYNFKMLPGSGPYVVHEEDIKKGNSITIRRRQDYWAENHRQHVGLNNFELIREIVVRDRNLEFEMFKKGDLDYYFVSSAQMWVEEMDFDNIQQGHIQKRKIFNHTPIGISGLAFNMRKVPFDDIRVRKALFHLFNREQMVEKLAYNQYQLQHSYYTGGVYESPDNPKILYDPELALENTGRSGLGQSGRERTPGEAGQSTGDGTALRESSFGKNTGPSTKKTCVKVGINLNLRLVTPETRFKLVMERQFDVVHLGWGALLFPNPETSYHSSLADVNNTNNVTGVKNRRIDEITEAYDRMFEQDERVAAIQEIDGILAGLYPYILQWTAPYQRIVYWNRYGQPAGYFTRVGDYTDLPSLWWIDPEKSQQLDEARGDSSIQLEVGETEDRYWLNFDNSVQKQTTSP